ncbi:MAG: methyltetrahydrofolate cobalamin methyltransferase [Desulfitobacteriaceae bacterium]
MLIIGELINSTRKSIAQAIEEKDADYLQQLAERQIKAGAHYIDVNAAATDNEVKNIQWLVEILQKSVDTPLCIDSPSVSALDAALQLCRGKTIVNSITAEKERWDEVLPLVLKYKTGVVALCMEDGGMPENIDDRLRIAQRLVSGLTAAGVTEEDIYLDPLIKPLGVNHQFGVEVLETTRALHEKYPRVHLISGLSNVSFGLPERRLINRAFMVMSVAVGMDSFILDPLDEVMMSLLAASRALASQDEFCLDYITGVRAGKIKA